MPPCHSKSAQSLSRKKRTTTGNEGTENEARISDARTAVESEAARKAEGETVVIASIIKRMKHFG